MSQEGRGYYGVLEVTAIDRKGNRYVFATPNTITYVARPLLAHLLVGDDAANKKIAKLGVGTGSVAPTRGDTALGAEVAQIPITEILYPAPGQVELRTLVEFVTPANGSILREAGLFSNDGTKLFARQVHTATPKDDNFRLEYVWRIVFT